MVEANTVPLIELNSGHKMPQLGLGTFLAKPEDTKAVVKAAILKYGYRHIDTAAFYKNEEAIGDALQEVFAESDIKREDLFLTTKLWQEDRDDVEAAAKASIEKLKCGYLDLYLVHWCNVAVDMEKAIIKKQPLEQIWKGMEAVNKAGLAKSIGVSNCTVALLMNLIAGAEITPAVNQVEMHPYLQQKQFVDLHNKFNVKVTAYSPIAAPNFPKHGDETKELKLFEEPTVRDLAQKYGKSGAQVVLRWHMQRGVIAIPKTVTDSRLPENINVFDFQLTEDEMAEMAKLDLHARIFNPLNFTQGPLAGIPLFS